MIVEHWSGQHWFGRRGGRDEMFQQESGAHLVLSNLARDIFTFGCGVNKPSSRSVR
jgi:hypothetical protein